MYLEHVVPKSNGKVYFIHGEKMLGNRLTEITRKENLLSIVLNSGRTQNVNIDGRDHSFPSWSLIALLSNQSFSFEEAESITIWQYNQDFYRLMDNNPEICLIWFVFSRFSDHIFLPLNEAYRFNLQHLQQMFADEFSANDEIKSDMLQILLKRLVMIIVRLSKPHGHDQQELKDEKYGIIRNFNKLVFNHYKTHHKVQFYACLLNKSPKTLANIFLQCRCKSPSVIIREKIINEAKRLFLYTDKSAKEIAYELGFNDAAHFSRFFKNEAQQNLSAFRKNNKSAKKQILKGEGHRYLAQFFD